MRGVSRTSTPSSGKYDTTLLLLEASLLCVINYYHLCSCIWFAIRVLTGPEKSCEVLKNEKGKSDPENS